MSAIYFLIFWIPAIASAVMLLLAGRTGVLNRPGGLAAWFALALGLQYVAGIFSPLWALGLILQTVLAIYLAIRIGLG